MAIVLPAPGAPAWLVDKHKPLELVLAACRCLC